MCRLVITLFLLCCLFTVYPSNDNRATDAPAMSLGGASVTTNNIYACFNNQSLLAFQTQTQVACSHAALTTVSDTRVMIAVPLSFGTVASSLSRLGNSLYSEMQLGFAYTRHFGNHFAASLQTDILSISPSPDQSSLYSFTAEIGLWAQPIDNLTLGFHIYNFINAKYETLFYDEPVPVNMRLGLSYTILDDCVVITEIENSNIYGTSVRGGLAYSIMDQLTIRCGAASNPSLASLGLGVRLIGLDIDVAAQAVRYIGKTGSVSIAYSF